MPARPDSELTRTNTAATPADWRKAAEESLAGAPFEKKLITRTPEGIDLQPIYTAEDTAKLPEQWPGLPPYVRGTEPRGPPPNGDSQASSAAIRRRRITLAMIRALLLAGVSAHAMTRAR